MSGRLLEVGLLADISVSLICSELSSAVGVYGVCCRLRLFTVALLVDELAAPVVEVLGVVVTLLYLGVWFCC